MLNVLKLYNSLFLHSLHAKQDAWCPSNWSKSSAGLKYYAFYEIKNSYMVT